MSNEWIKVKPANELPVCECCDERWCEECNEHFFECSCVGLFQDDDFEYKWLPNNDGVDEPWARKITGEVSGEN